MDKFEDIYWDGIERFENIDPKDSSAIAVYKNGKRSRVKIPSALFHAIWKAAEDGMMNEDAMKYERDIFTDGDIH